MQSNNPVFRRSAEFNGSGANAYGNQTYAGNGAAYPGYGQPGYSDPATWGTGTPTQAAPAQPMTIDSVVQKTGLSLGIVVVAAALTWWLTPNISDPSANLGPLMTALTLGSLGAFALSMVNSFKRLVSPALVMAFCVFEGIALGALSKYFDAMFSTSTSGNIVVNAVVGTIAAFAGTLGAYKYFNIQVGNRFRKFVVSAVFGMVALSLLEMVLGMFGSQLGLFGFGTLGLLMAVAGLVLGVFMLIMDFDFVERGVAAGLDERESWRAAFALTVSLVWIYTNLLRIMAIFAQD